LGLGRSARAGLNKAIDAADIIHIHGLWEPLVLSAAQAAREAGLPYIIRCCGMLDEWALARKAIRKRIYLAMWLRSVLESANALHCSTDMERTSTERLGIPTPIIVEPNGIAGDEFEQLPARSLFRTTLGLGTAPLIVFLGRIHPGKGLEYLIPALGQMQRADAHLAVLGAGDAGFERRMRALCGEHDVAQRVHFLGFVAGRERISPLVDADLLALPSEHENFGVAAIEALAAGCPAIVSRYVGLATEICREQIGDATSLDPSEIALTLDRWLNDDHRRQIARQRARQFVMSHFNWSDIAQRWLVHYTRILSCRSITK
jgi:glycosyltransferase involved in cell wall biosynthesis